MELQEDTLMKDFESSEEVLEETEAISEDFDRGVQQLSLDCKGCEVELLGVPQTAGSVLVTIGVIVEDLDEETPLVEGIKMLSDFGSLGK